MDGCIGYVLQRVDLKVRFSKEKDRTFGTDTIATWHRAEMKRPWKRATTRTSQRVQLAARLSCPHFSIACRVGNRRLINSSLDELSCVTAID
jgi:hypothetical protein